MKQMSGGGRGPSEQIGFFSGERKSSLSGCLSNFGKKCKVEIIALVYHFLLILIKSVLKEILEGRVSSIVLYRVTVCFNMYILENTIVFEVPNVFNQQHVLG